MSSYLSEKTSSEWIRYKDVLWIPHRKRTYLYWFKFLQEVERSPDHKVNWRKYRGWGGANEVMGSKFDEWWNEHWKELFAVPSKGVPREKQKFPLNTKQPKTEAIRISWLVWMHRDTDPNYRPKNLKERLGDGGRDVDHYKQKKRGSNHIAIARKIIATEKRQQTYLLPIDPDSDLNTNEDKTIASLIGRYKHRAKKIVENVCEGNFP